MRCVDEDQVAGHWRTFRFRVLKSSWGIAVDLTARTWTGVDVPRRAIQVGSRTWLDVSSGQLTSVDVDQLVFAARRVADSIEAARPGANVTIDVRDVAYALTDYQAEGLAAALIGWAIEEFELEYPAIQITFDSEQNWYEFDW